MFRIEALNFPKSILIETYSLCQGECGFCPYKEIRGKNEVDILSTKKYKELITEISNYNINRLTLFNNNEPLLDNRIYDFVLEARKLMPNVEIGLSSNGRVINSEKLLKLLENGLTTLYISIPCIDRENYKKVMGIYPDKIFETLDSIEDEKLFKMIRIAVPKTIYYKDDIIDRFKNFKICTWNLEYKESWGIHDKFMKIADKDSYAGLCDRPMDQAVISSNGNVLICCRDWQEQNVVGNVYNSKLYDIWHSEKMQEIQQFISNSEYDKVECCKDCVMSKGAYKR